MSRDEAAELLAEIEAKRGYVLDMHRTLATADPDFLRAYEQFLGSAYLSSRSLDRREKELVYVAALTALGAPRQQLVAHFRAGLDAGATAAELLETLEQVLPPVGVPRFIDGLAAWSEACGAAAPGGDPPDDEGSE